MQIWYEMCASKFVQYLIILLLVSYNEFLKDVYSKNVEKMNFKTMILLNQFLNLT